MEIARGNTGASEDLRQLLSRQSSNGLDASKRGSRLPSRLIKPTRFDFDVEGYIPLGSCTCHCGTSQMSITFCLRYFVDIQSMIMI